MEIDLSTLKDFIDFGGSFIFGFLLLVYGYKRLGSIEEKLVSILTLLSIITKTNTNFNGIEYVLGNSGDKVAQRIVDAESKDNV